MEIISNIPFALDAGSLAKTAHVAAGSDDAREFEALVNEVRRQARPKAIYKECFIGAKGKDAVAVENVTFTSRAMRMNLDKVERVFAFIVTCGHEVDRIEIAPDDFLKRFWLDAIKAELLQFGRTHLRNHLDRRYKLGKTAGMAPGSGDADVWPIEQQKELFAIFGDVEKLIGVKLTDSCLMIPNKTVSGICFQTEANFQSCQLCHREKCPGRRAPFDKQLWDSVN